MLPTDLMTLINIYNEPGIFIYFGNSQIYWFNGKRFVFWCEAPSYLILTYDNELYSRDFSIKKYMNKTFIPIKVPTLWNHPLHLFLTRNWQQTLCNGNVYRINKHFEMFDGNKYIEIPEFRYIYGRILAHGDDIYIFGSETVKFNTITRKWTFLSSTHLPTFQMYSFNGDLFNLSSYENYKYDPKIDVWNKIKIIIPNL